jgi:hypothetical protein
VCKAPDATLAPPSFQSHLAFNLPILSTGSGCSNRPAKIRPVRTLISIVTVFLRGNAATLTRLSEELTFPTVKGGSQHELRPSMLLRAYTLLTALLALLAGRPHASANSPVDSFSRCMSY